jgi:hypothetical protein
MRPLHDPAMRAEPLRRLDALARDARRNPAPLLPRIIRLQLFGALARAIDGALLVGSVLVLG